ncbi:hypothetical protein J0H58_30200 [bacterium]|nr:hypothetical protein [bacterium]
MSWPTVVSLLASAAGVLVLLESVWEWGSGGELPGPREGPAVLLGRAVVLAVAAGPYLAVAASAWAVRRDRRRARVVAGVAGAVLAIGLGGWVWAAGVVRGAERASGLVVVAGGQLATWLGGAIVTGGRAGRVAGPRAATDRGLDGE